MANFFPPQPGQTIMYVCTKCGARFPHKIPSAFLGILKKTVKCPFCGSPAAKDPSVRY